MSIDFDPIIVKRIDGSKFRIHQGYRHGPFILHRSVGHRGWTITHYTTREAVIQRLRSLTFARQVATEFERLSSKWGQCKRRYHLWGEFQRVMNVREQFAIASYIVHLRNVHHAL